jgi:hypothetical protein
MYSHINKFILESITNVDDRCHRFVVTSVAHLTASSYMEQELNDVEDQSL